jgi:hypothetical protein
MRVNLERRGHSGGNFGGGSLARGRCNEAVPQDTFKLGADESLRVEFGQTSMARLGPLAMESRTNAASV